MLGFYHLHPSDTLAEFLILTAGLSTARWPFLCFLPQVIHLSPFLRDASESQVVVCGPQLFKNSWGHHSLWPKFHHGILPSCNILTFSLLVEICLLFPSCSIAHFPTLWWLGNYGRWWHNIGSSAPSSIQDREFSLPPQPPNFNQHSFFLLILSSVSIRAKLLGHWKLYPLF